MLIKIPSTTVINSSYALYNIEFYEDEELNDSKVLRISKRFSDFTEFKKNLENSINKTINTEFPSKLYFKSSIDSQVLEERRVKLEQFLNHILEDTALRNNDILRNFLNLPYSSLISFKPGESLNERSSALKTHSWNTIYDDEVNNNMKDLNAKEWLDMLKDVKLLIQDCRSKIFENMNNSNSNNDQNLNNIQNTSNFKLVECRKNLAAINFRLEILNKNLNNPNFKNQLGKGEVIRRQDLFNSLNRDYKDMNALLVSISTNSKNNSNNNNNNDNDNGTNNASSSNRSNLFSSSTRPSRRTLGKPRETEVTKTMDNSELHQYQQQMMQSQDEDIMSLRKIIERQRQIGHAINEELNIQNEILDGFNSQVDESSRKINYAKKKIGKIV
ncbi:unnamed protein product [[Candida] boidinii]|uniref:Unnamed protein product n=1 Tax=Candida boidinii TaxID=5477 RepID=A0ACB5TFI3_CANBO|nr:unnamed protein product [[Candida] boidinii]